MISINISTASLAETEKPTPKNSYGIARHADNQNNMEKEE